MSQTATFTQVEKLSEIASQNASLLSLQRSLSAGALVGHAVSWTAEDGTTQTGTVSSVRFGGDEPTAVVAHNDVVALRELDRLHRNGLRVPQDVSVTGYDDTALAAHALIGLTTVGTDAEPAGEVAAEQLIQAVREHRHVRHRHLQPARLAVRRTTGPARGRRDG